MPLLGNFKSSFSSKVCSTVQRIEFVVKQEEKQYSLKRGPLSTQPRIVSQATGPHDFFITLLAKKQK